MTENPHVDKNGTSHGIDIACHEAWNEGYNQAIEDLKKESPKHTMRIDEMHQALEGSPKVPVITLVEVNALAEALKKVSE